MAAYRRDIEAAPDPDGRRREIEEMLNELRSPFRTAESFGIEEIIDPRDTRATIAKGLALAAHKRLETPRKKHGIIPV